MVTLATLAWVLLGYLAGSIPFGVIVGKLRGVDIRAVGSGNIGATNAARALGKPLGVVVLLCDAAKGAVPVLIAAHYLDPWGTAAVGGAAFVGHLAPPWLGFRGGKGVATAFGVFLALAPLATAGAAAVFVVAYALTRTASVGSLLATTVFVPAVWWATHDPARAALAAFMWLLIVIKHRGNIGRLWRREESKV